MRTTRPACVVGDMDLVRALGVADIPVISAGSIGREARWSRHTTSHLSLSGSWDEPGPVVDALVAFGRRQPERPVLYYQKDHAALAVSRHREQLSETFDFVIPAADLVENLLHKERFQRLAREHDLRVPGARTITGAAAIDDESLEHAYPVVVKPSLRERSTATWTPVAGQAKAVLCENRDQLARLLRRSELDGIALVVQAWIPGAEDRIWSYHAFVDDDGTVVAEFTGRKIRTWPVAFGQSTAVEVRADAEVAGMGRSILSTLGFTGVAKVDLKRDPGGGVHLLEINPRFNLWHHVGAMAGVNIPAAVHHHFGSSPIAQVGPARDGVNWCKAWSDFAAARAGGVGLGSWLRFVATCDARRGLHRDDPGAALGMLASRSTRRRGSRHR